MYETFIHCLSLLALPTTINIKHNSSLGKRNCHLLKDAMNDNEQKAQGIILNMHMILVNKKSASTIYL